MGNSKTQGQGFWNLCPASARHGYLRVVRTANGGLLAVCPKCWVGDASTLKALLEGVAR